MSVSPNPNTGNTPRPLPFLGHAPFPQNPTEANPPVTGDPVPNGTQGALFIQALQEPPPKNKNAPWERTQTLKNREKASLEEAVMYMAATNSSLHDNPDAKNNPKIGIMANPDNKTVPREIQAGRAWCTDNGAYSGRFNPDVFERWLDQLSPHHETCKFAVSPDQLMDWAGTLLNFETWSLKIRMRGFPVAIVAHRGCTPASLPDADCLFVPAMNLDDPNLMDVIREAKRRHMWIHLGRVNSMKRMRHAKMLGCDSADGTHLKHRGVDWGLFDVAQWVWGSATVAQNRTLLTHEQKVVPFNQMPSDSERLTARRRQAAQAAGETLLDQTEPQAGMPVLDFITGQAGTVHHWESPLSAEGLIELHHQPHPLERQWWQVCTLKRPEHQQVILKTLRKGDLEVEWLDTGEAPFPPLTMDDTERTLWEEERTLTREEREMLDRQFLHDLVSKMLMRKENPLTCLSVCSALKRLGEDPGRLPAWLHAP